MAFLGRVGKKTLSFMELIGRGGEATVLRHPRDKTLAGRFSHDPQSIDIDRIEAMIGNEPHPSHERGFPCFAWPVDIIIHPSTGHMIGTVIRYAAEAVPLSQVTNPCHRLQSISPAWLLRVARSLAFRAYAAEWQKFFISDFNPENFLIDRHGLVCGVDCDSYEFTGPRGKLFECKVGLPEFTAPELLNGTGQATRYSVAWSAMTLIHMLIRDGEHPFNSAKTDPPLVTRITQGLWPDSGKYLAYPPPKGAKPLSAFHNEFQALCHGTFEEGFKDPTKRPTLCEIVKALDRMGAV